MIRGRWSSCTPTHPISIILLVAPWSSAYLYCFISLISSTHLCESDMVELQLVPQLLEKMYREY